MRRLSQQFKGFVRGFVHVAKRFGSRYLKGFYEVGGSRLYVNCGVGSSSWPIRAGAPSEVAILTLRAA